MALRAPVLVCLDWWDIENAVAEGAEADGGVADLGLVGQGDVEHRDAIHNGRGDGCEEEEERADEEEGDADPVAMLSVGAWSPRWSGAGLVTYQWVRLAML